jgi:hypothetical protein
MMRYLFQLILLGSIEFTAYAVNAQQFSVLYNLTGSPDGALPYAGLFRDSGGNL